MRFPLCSANQILPSGQLEQVRENEVPSKYMAACGAVVVIGLFCWAGYAFFQYLLH